MAIMGIIGVPVFFLGILGLITPFSTFEKPVGGTVFNFILTFSNAAWSMEEFSLMRIAGYFDEPGTFAYYITLALLTNKIYDYSKSLEWTLVVTGLFTISLAFIITLMFYYFIFYNPLRSFKSLIIFLILVLSILYYGISYSDKEELHWHTFLYKQTIGRLYISEEGSDRIFAGDNRSHLFTISKDAFIESPLIGHGPSSYDNVKSKYYGKLGANLLAPLAIHGIIGAPIVFLIYIYWTCLVFVHLRRSNIILLGAWFIVSLNFAQRPDVTGGLYGYFVMIFLVEATNYRLSFLKRERLPKSKDLNM
jgi:hypothetical protein